MSLTRYNVLYDKHVHSADCLFSNDPYLRSIQIATMQRKSGNWQPPLKYTPGWLDQRYKTF